MYLGDFVKIIKYKFLSNSRYELVIDDNKYILYEDIILKHSVLLKKEISQEELKSLLDENSFYELYYAAIAYLNKKMHTEKEVFDYLKRYYPDCKDVDRVVELLKTRKLINDQYYAKVYTEDAIKLKDIGPYKIKEELTKLGVLSSYQDIVFELFTNDIQEDKIKKIIFKKQKTNKDSVILFKKKILFYIQNKGYDRKKIENILSMISFDDSENYKKEYDKLYKKLSKKYSGKELEFQLKRKLYEKGYTYEEN